MKVALELKKKKKKDVYIKLRKPCESPATSFDEI